MYEFITNNFMTDTNMKEKWGLTMKDVRRAVAEKFQAGDKVKVSGIESGTGYGYEGVVDGIYPFVIAVKDKNGICESFTFDAALRALSRQPAELI